MWQDFRQKRLNMLTFVVILVIGVLVLRLAWMQVLKGAYYKQIAEDNRIREISVQAPRGTIYDRNGAILVSNRPSFSISIVPLEYINQAEETALLAGITGVSPDAINMMLEKGREFPYTPIPIKRDADAAMLTKIEERKEYLPGVTIEATPVRYYLYNQMAAQVFGYVGTISEEEYAEKKRQGYKPQDLLGKAGLERQWEEVLRGTRGGQQVEVNALGEETGVIGNKPGKPGNGIVLTIDANLQKAAEDILDAQIAASRVLGENARGGAIVVLNPKTGAILAMASKPSFDPNLFAGGISSKDWNGLINNPNYPLTNRAIESAYPPGSVFKIVTASAALETNLTSNTEVFEDKGVYILSGWKFFGWDTKGLGKLTIVDALAWSSDPVFYELARRMGTDTLASYAVTFGLGNPTGIMLPGEESGFVPTESWKQETYNEPWYPGETLIAGIGQGYYLTTPLQQAVLLMAVANGGIIYKPTLVDKIISPEGQVLQAFQPEVARTVYLRPEVWDTVRKGLTAVTVSGTAASVFSGFSQTIAGKTGSAETGKGTTHSWFACYGPTTNPEVVVAVLIEEGGEGSVAAAPVARRVLEAYFGLKPGEIKPTKAD